MNQSEGQRSSLEVIRSFAKVMSSTSMSRLFSSRSGGIAPSGGPRVGPSELLVSDNLALALDVGHSTHSLNWGEPLQPHHFDFSQASRVIFSGAPSMSCSAIFVPGTGSFQESRESQPVPFHDGAIIVRANNLFKLVEFDKFRARFCLATGRPIENPYQIDFQTPKK